MAELRDGDLLYDKDGKLIGMAQWSAERHGFVVVQNVTDDAAFIEALREAGFLHKAGNAVK